MSVKKPTISIILTVYNSKNYIKSIFNNLNSLNYPKNLLEIIFVDDFSTDNTIEKIVEQEQENRKLNIIIITKKKNSGVANSRNLALLKASGNYITFLDDDDIMGVDKILIQAQFMMQKKFLATFTNNTEFFEKNPKKTNLHIVKHCKLTNHHFKLHNRFSFPTLMIYRSLKKIKFPEKLKSVEDLVYLFNLTKHVKYIYKCGNRTDFYYRRIRKGSLSASKFRQLKNYFRAQNSYISRKKPIISIFYTIKVILFTFKLKILDI